MFRIGLDAKYLHDRRLIGSEMIAHHMFEQADYGRLALLSLPSGFA